jgi:hypothetical protein
METISTGFVKGKLSIAKDRLYTDTGEGGLGLIDIRSYISALQVSWFKKIRGKPYDNWRRDIFNLCDENIFIANRDLAAGKFSPVLEGLFAEFHKFRTAFLKDELNILKSDLLYNPVLKRWGDVT